MLIAINHSTNFPKLCNFIELYENTGVANKSTFKSWMLPVILLSQPALP